MNFWRKKRLAFSALLIGLFVPHHLQIKEEGGAEATPGGLLAGLHFIARNRLFLAIVTTVLVTNLLDSAMFSVALPDYARQVWNSVLPLGVLSGAFGGCAFLSTILFGIFGQRWPRRMTFALCFIAVGARFWTLAAMLPLPWQIASYAFCGLAVGPINPIATTVQQEMVPTKMRASIFGAVSAGAMAGMPIGGLLAGFLIDRIGLVSALLAMGTCYLLATGSLLVNPTMKDMDVERIDEERDRIERPEREPAGIEKP